MKDSFQIGLRIDSTHPALPGHFPDHPVVPGVVLLERVAAAWKTWRGARVGKLEAKFMRPLLPGEQATIALRADDAKVRFSVMRADGVTLARGSLEAGSDILPP